MSVVGYAQSLSAIGYTVRRENGVHWFNAHPHICMSFPFDREIVLDAIEWEPVLGKDGWTARFLCDLKVGRPSYRIIADQSDYGLHCLSGKARNQTRRGLEQCEVRAVSFEELLTHGLTLNRETMVRQNRKIGSGFDAYWKKYYANAALAEGAEAWGAFVDGKLAAYLIAFRMEDVSHILIVRSSFNFLRCYPNNALMYGYLAYALNMGGLREVSIGLESIQEGMDTLDHFKTGMGFRKQPIGQRIVLRPFLQKTLGGTSGMKIARFVLRDGWGSERVSKLVGLLRWYSDQPEAL